ncbi:hypothetical protein FB451DRAFT_1182820 [Mycena latifolia]|nr:hypothetical protein FB451DRAFT_1182820 [Mycena latifolia]
MLTKFVSSALLFFALIPHARGRSYSLWRSACICPHAGLSLHVRKQRILLPHTREPVPPQRLFLSQDRIEQLKEVTERRNVHATHMFSTCWVLCQLRGRNVNIVMKGRIWKHLQIVP